MRLSSGLLSIAFASSIVALSSSAAAQVTVAVDPAGEARPISPWIYGANFPSDGQLDAGRFTVARWGGNAVTRYNYEIDATNRAFDYYFENIPGCWSEEGGWCQNPPADPKEQSGANAFLGGMKARGVATLFTIPTIGWVVKPPPQYGQPFACGCPASVDPNQTSFDPYNPECGNGRRPDGSYATCAPPEATSVATSPEWAREWVAYIVQEHGPSNGQRIYALDNEPALWRHTHSDIRTQPLGFDELWQRMRDYAVAILEADPTAEIAGPAEWGWPNYFCSDADDTSQGCSPSSPDRAAHGGAELVAWLLQQARDHEEATGQRILHYLDLHYYPQDGSANAPDNTRSLWDPTYVDPTWINDTIRLVPRMRAWVDENYPGTKLAISEWDFYRHDEPVGAVSFAEVLGIFAREGVHLATAWGTPAEGQLAFAAFRLYRNYDGNGGQFEAVSVPATVTGDGVEAYASVSQSRMTVALVNEGGADAEVTVTLGNFEPEAMAALYGNQGGAAISKLADVPVGGNQVTVTLGPTSIAMLVVNGNNPNNLPDPTTSSSSTGGGNGPGAGGNGAGGAGGNASDGDDGGCGCRAAGAPGGTALWALAAAAGLAAATRRRRHRGSR